MGLVGCGWGVLNWDGRRELVWGKATLVSVKQREKIQLNSKKAKIKLLV